MKGTVLCESLLLCFFGIVSMVEALRLIIFKNPYVLYDTFGPGWFILLASIGFMITSAAYFFKNYKKTDGDNTAVADQEATRTVVFAILAATIYIYSINFVGYTFATAVFFLLGFRIFGVKPWRKVALLTVLLTGIFYVTFVKFCAMIFPRGYLFSLFNLF